MPRPRQARRPQVSVFGAFGDLNRHFTTGPVAGFLVNDVLRA